jgi:hypothetical protein
MLCPKRSFLFQSIEQFVKQSIVELVCSYLISVEEEEEFVHADSTTINNFFK